MLHNFFLKTDITILRHGSLNNIVKHNIPKFEAKNPKNDLVIVVQKLLKFVSKCQLSKSILQKKYFFYRNLCFYNMFFPNIITFNVKNGCNWEI